MFARETGGQ
jgi:hypothetical protein